MNKTGTSKPTRSQEDCDRAIAYGLRRGKANRVTTSLGIFVGFDHEGRKEHEGHEGQLRRSRSKTPDDW
jgi:hypothetical protein